MVSNSDDRKPICYQGADDAGHVLKKIIAKIAHRHIVGLGKILGKIAYFLDVPHRRIVRRNLQFAHPAWTREKVENVSRRVFQNLGISFLEFFQLATLSRKQVLGRVRVVGLENLQNALASGKGLILVSAKRLTTHSA